MVKATRPALTGKANSRLALTVGEPAGIGPDLVVQLAQHELLNDVVLIASPELLEQRAAQLDLPFQWLPENAPADQSGVRLSPVELNTTVTTGELDPENAGYVLETLRLAAEGCLTGRYAGVVTAPVHKGVINEAGLPFTGHTEFFANLCGEGYPVMMLATPGLRVALATTHLPLREVPDEITPALLRQVITILHQDLQHFFGIEKPRILVCGLNPHAGESGHLGREEIDIIDPLLKALRGDGLDLIGPLPADTAFTARHLEQADAVLAMYHDQGLPVLKYAGFGKAVNITLGLPIIRTSVDHGTALDLAGTGRADAGSLEVALAYARDMVQTSRERHDA